LPPSPDRQLNTNGQVQDHGQQREKETTQAEGLKKLSEGGDGGADEARDEARRMAKFEKMKEKKLAEAEARALVSYFPLVISDSL
jgi:hypothetical protein